MFNTKIKTKTTNSVILYKYTNNFFFLKLLCSTVYWEHKNYMYIVHTWNIALKIIFSPEIITDGPCTHNFNTINIVYS